MKRTIIGALALTTIGLAACGSSSGDSSTSTKTTGTAAGYQYDWNSDNMEGHHNVCDMLESSDGNQEFFVTTMLGRGIQNVNPKYTPAWVRGYIKWVVDTDQCANV